MRLWLWHVIEPMAIACALACIGAFIYEFSKGWRRWLERRRLFNRWSAMYGIQRMPFESDVQLRERLRAAFGPLRMLKSQRDVQEATAEMLRISARRVDVTAPSPGCFEVRVKPWLWIFHVRESKLAKAQAQLEKWIPVYASLRVVRRQR